MARHDGILHVIANHKFVITICGEIRGIRAIYSFDKCIIRVDELKKKERKMVTSIGVARDGVSRS